MLLLLLQLVQFCARTRVYDYWLLPSVINSTSTGV